MNARPVPAPHFVATIACNVDNRKLSDKEFREMVRDSLPVVEYAEHSGFYEQYTSADMGKGPKRKSVD